jgi:hypothetical protein
MEEAICLVHGSGPLVRQIVVEKTDEYERRWQIRGTARCTLSCRDGMRESYMWNPHGGGYWVFQGYVYP